MKTPLARLAVLPLALGLSLTACSSDEEKSEENRAAACTAIETLRTEVEEMRTTLTADSTVEEWREARDVLEANVEKVDDELDEVAEDSADEIEAAWDAFTDAVAAVDEDATVPEAGQGLVEEFQKLQDVRAKVATGLDCT